MIKHTNGWEIVKKLKLECKVFVRNFPGATTQCMPDYMKPSIRAKLNHFILHVGTNDFNLNRPPEKVAKSHYCGGLILLVREDIPSHLVTIE